MQDFLKAAGVNNKMRKRCTTYCFYAQEQRKSYSDLRDVRSAMAMFSPALRQDLSFQIHKQFLSECSLFRSTPLPTQVLKQICQSFENVVYGPHEYVARKGHFANCAYFLTRGKLQLEHWVSRSTFGHTAASPVKHTRNGSGTVQDPFYSPTSTPSSRGHGHGHGHAHGPLKGGLDTNIDTQDFFQLHESCDRNKVFPKAEGEGRLAVEMHEMGHAGPIPEEVLPDQRFYKSVIFTKMLGKNEVIGDASLFWQCYWYVALCCVVCRPLIRCPCPYPTVACYTLSYR